MMNDGRKIDRSMEDPIDNILIDISYQVGKVIKHIPYMSPNVITSLSLIFSLYAIYKIFNGFYVIGGILLFFGYFLDCLDGNFARSNNMVTDFGDYYDHISDITKYIFLISVILMLKIKVKTKALFLFSILIFCILSFIQIDCQEKNSKASKSNTLNFFVGGMCPHKNYIYKSRYFGTGMASLLKCLFIMNIEFINKIL
ncbi:putative CDP-alcohol phosphatidyltransferase [Aureococcus anophagefferens virus]|uniref:Putative CDP-alcohol phosphatidyltransferase n=1 Tax=Aureococcus anophagefferens virus TaxID=1474867 RepID=A0A076FHD7_9VIRU|nr:putative CDP-alcohol phosphatidyltransferase [Aureococcus anophagefferens virus]AII17182.1 putative CDP-alcohol phosphatidyltransferase [Aureococcus anophagefferens virus]